MYEYKNRAQCFNEVNQFCFLWSAMIGILVED